MWFFVNGMRWNFNGSRCQRVKKSLHSSGFWRFSRFCRLGASLALRIVDRISPFETAVVPDPEALRIVARSLQTNRLTPETKVVEL